MVSTGNTFFAGKQPQLSSEEEKCLFDAGHSYLSNGVPEAAYYCFDRITETDLPTLFNKALCCYLSGWYEECHRLLSASEHLLPCCPSAHPSLPAQLLPGSFNDRLHLSPMSRGVPHPLARTQFFRLKAESAFRLRLYGEVKIIAAALQQPYRHIDELITQISHETECH